MLNNAEDGCVIGENASNYKGGLKEVERPIIVGFTQILARSNEVCTRKPLRDDRLLTDFRSTQPTTLTVLYGFRTSGA